MESDRRLAEGLQVLSGRLIDHATGILDVVMASYNHLATCVLPRMVNDMRPIQWSVRNASDGSALAVTIHIRFCQIQRPHLTDNQILLPLQAQQLGRSWGGPFLVWKGAPSTTDAFW